MKKTESKKTETKKAETKKPTAGTKRPFWDGRSRASTPGYKANYNSQAEKGSKIKGMNSIAKFLKEELLHLNNIRVVA